MGFEDTNYADVQKNIRVIGNKIESLVNGNSHQYGKLEVLSLQELKEISPPREVYNGSIKVNQIVANVTDLHND
jgi:hypothetical protein